MTYRGNVDLSVPWEPSQVRGLVILSTYVYREWMPCRPAEPRKEGDSRRQLSKRESYYGDLPAMSSVTKSFLICLYNYSFPMILLYKVGLPVLFFLLAGWSIYLIGRQTGHLSIRIGDLGWLILCISEVHISTWAHKQTSSKNALINIQCHSLTNKIPYRSVCLLRDTGIFGTIHYTRTYLLRSSIPRCD